MKSRDFLLVVVLTTIVVFSGNLYVGAGVQNNGSKSVLDSLIDSQGRPCQSILDLLNCMGVVHNGTLESIVKETQKKWLRAKGKELWEVRDTYTTKRKELWPIFKKIGCTDELWPMKKQYDYLLIHGALVHRMRSRIAFAIKLWKQGVRFKKVIFLSGSRKLDPALEKKDVLLHSNNGILPIRPSWELVGDLPTTEVTAMQMIYNQADMPDAMRSLPVQVVDAPERLLSDGSTTRPTTDDTIYGWLKFKPKAGLCLAISNQPYIGRQHAALKSLLPKKFSVESVGDAMLQKNENMSLMLDTVARWLYQERLFYIKKTTNKSD